MGDDLFAGASLAFKENGSHLASGDPSDEIENVGHLLRGRDELPA